MAEASEPAIRARGLTKTYGSGPAAVEVLRGVDLEVAAGEFIAILGPSGSGKSTLLHLLGLMDRCDGGELSLRGRRADTLDEAGRARLRGQEVGFVFQFDSMLPEFTIEENVLMPACIAAGTGSPGAPTRERARLLLESLGVAATRARFPAQTSGGERQRAAVARALLGRPALLLADEPTGNLDRENGTKVFSDLKRVARQEGTAIVLVTHDEINAAAADRILRMDAGVLRAG